MGTRKSSAEYIPTLALVHRHNAMVYKAPGLNSVPFDSDPFISPPVSLAPWWGSPNALDYTKIYTTRREST